uniref:Lariat debranching enzyme C-terminal domain-containing protein n=1 Tax=Ditylenchus dipsaci TaxID=166011 RepID=A0A915D102_9BILA
MSELPNGGWVAPNIYYLGYASVVQFGGLRIAGLSGIYKGNDYDKAHFECPPFTNYSLVSAYHVRSVEVFRLKQLKKPDFEEASAANKDDVERNQLGNPATMNLLYDLRPNRWFSAHLHVKFTAEFLALDKPLPRRQFLECLDVPMQDEAALELSYDPTWLAILKNTDHLTQLSDKKSYMPGRNAGSSERYDFRPTKQELDEVATLFNNDFRIPSNFCQTAPPEQKPFAKRRDPPSLYYRNPQSTVFCEKLGIKDLNFMMCQSIPPGSLGVPYCCEHDGVASSNNPDEINVGVMMISLVMMIL